jgi:hypothetical protein
MECHCNIAFLELLSHEYRSLPEPKRKYRNNLPFPQDTTIDGATALLTPGFLCYVGQLLFGERWQTPLAQMLGDVRGRKLSPATMHQWTTATRAIPAWVQDALVTIVERSHADLECRARMARELAARMSQHATREAAAESLPCRTERRMSATRAAPLLDDRRPRAIRSIA